MKGSRPKTADLSRPTLQRYKHHELLKAEELFINLCLTRRLSRATLSHDTASHELPTAINTTRKLSACQKHCKASHINRFSVFQYLSRQICQELNVHSCSKGPVCKIQWHVMIRSQPSPRGNNNATIWKHARIMVVNVQSAAQHKPQRVSGPLSSHSNPVWWTKKTKKKQFLTF